MNWFTIEKIDDKTYAISEYKHWEQMHSYLLLGNEKATLIDTGLGIGKIKEVVKKITNLPIVVLTTHVHWDHIGGHSEFDDIRVHEGDSRWLEEGLPIPIEAIKSNVIKDVEVFPKGFDIKNYKIFKRKPSDLLSEGQLIDIGDRIIEVIHTPGHSPGHVCFYDVSNKYLFSGDLIYKGTLFAFYPSTNPVEYKKSVEKILGYDISKIMPAHNLLDVEAGFAKKVHNGFCLLEREYGLAQGSGVFDFEEFSIHI